VKTTFLERTRGLINFLNKPFTKKSKLLLLLHNSVVFEYLIIHIKVQLKACPSIYPDRIAVLIETTSSVEPSLHNHDSTKPNAANPIHSRSCVILSKVLIQPFLRKKSSLYLVYVFFTLRVQRLFRKKLINKVKSARV